MAFERFPILLFGDVCETSSLLILRPARTSAPRLAPRTATSIAFTESGSANKGAILLHHSHIFLSQMSGEPMSRPFARLKLGYFPLPIAEAGNIRPLLVASD